MRPNKKGAPVKVRLLGMATGVANVMGLISE
jgi:hypothetical protein